MQCWKSLFRYNPKTDSFKDIYERAQKNMKLAKELRVLTIVENALKDAKAFFKTK